MKLFKIGMLVIGVALLMNCTVNAWIGNYVLAGSEATSLLWMVAYWFLQRSHDLVVPIAEREEAWKVCWNDTRRWLAEFPDAADALDHLHQAVHGVRSFDIQRLRDNMRARRDEHAETQRELGSNQMATSLRDVHGNLIADAIVQFFDEWEQVLPSDAHEALRPVAEKARAALKGAR